MKWTSLLILGLFVGKLAKELLILYDRGLLMKMN
jgi:hypothetical protein